MKVKINLTAVRPAAATNTRARGRMTTTTGMHHGSGGVVKLAGEIGLNGHNLLALTKLLKNY